MSKRTFGSTRKLPSGQWQASYWHEGARHIAPSTFGTKTDAVRWLSTTHNDVSRGQWFDPRRAQVRFDEWADSWKENVVDLRPSTFVRDVDYLNRYITPVFGALPLGDISVGRIRTWVADLNASGLAPATVVKAGQILSKVPRSAVEEGVLSTNPCAAVRLPRLERTEMRYLSPGEVARLADAIDPRYRAVVFLGAYGGLRAGELFGLRVPRLDLSAQRLDIVEQVVEVSGNLHFGPPKTKAGRRSVPLPAIVCDELSQHLRQWPSDDLVFTAPDGGPVRLASWRSRFFKRPSTPPVWHRCASTISVTPLSRSGSPPAHRHGRSPLGPDTRRCRSSSTVTDIFCPEARAESTTNSTGWRRQHWWRCRAG